MLSRLTAGKGPAVTELLTELKLSVIRGLLRRGGGLRGGLGIFGMAVLQQPQDAGEEYCIYSHIRSPLTWGDPLTFVPWKTLFSAKFPLIYPSTVLLW